MQINNKNQLKNKIIINHPDKIPTHKLFNQSNQKLINFITKINPHYAANSSFFQDLLMMSTSLLSLKNYTD